MIQTHSIVRVGVSYLGEGWRSDLPVPFPYLAFRRDDVTAEKGEQGVLLYRFGETVSVRRDFLYTGR